MQGVLPTFLVSSCGCSETQRRRVERASFEDCIGISTLVDSGSRVGRSDYGWSIMEMPAPSAFAEQALDVR